MSLVQQWVLLPRGSHLRGALTLSGSIPEQEFTSPFLLEQKLQLNRAQGRAWERGQGATLSPTSLVSARGA